MDKYESLKTGFEKLLDDTIAREKSAPVGAFPNDIEVQKHLKLLQTLEACRQSFKLEYQKLDNEQNPTQSILEPQISDAEIV